MNTTADVKKLIPNYCETITTKEIAEALGISTSQAYNLCVEAEKEGWLFRFGYHDKQGGYIPVEADEVPKKSSLTWQNVEENNLNTPAQ